MDDYTALGNAVMQVFVKVLCKENHTTADDIKVLKCEYNRDPKKGFIKSAKGILTFVVPERSLNAGGSMFGGQATCLSDIFTSWLLMNTDLLSFEGKTRNSVSTFLQSEYIGAAKLDDIVRVEVCLDRIGKDVLFSGADFFNHESNALLYRTRHQKKIFSNVFIEWEHMKGDGDETNQNLVGDMMEKYRSAHKTFMLEREKSSPKL